GHDAAGRVLGVSEELLDVRSFFLVHELDELFARLLRQVLQEIDGLIGIHLFEDVGGALLIEVTHDRRLHLGVDLEMQAAIVGDLDEERAADILEEMDPDEAVDLLQDLPEETREELIELMDEEEGADVEELLAYPEDSAGGIMTTDFLALPRDLTTGQAIDRLRELQPDPALVYYLYVVDAEGKLDGNVSLRDLVVAAPDTPLSKVMNPNVLRVEADTDKEEVAALIAKYDLLALPVVDARR